MRLEKEPIQSVSRYPTVSVVIPCKNSEKTLETCLKALLQQTEAALEVIVVNDNSTDRTAEIAQKFPVVLKNTHLGTSAGAARNSGAESAQGEVVAFIDSDCEASPDWLAKIKNNFAKDPDLGAVGGRYSHPSMKSSIGKLVALEEEYCHHDRSMNPTTGNRSRPFLSVRALAS